MRKKSYPTVSKVAHKLDISEEELLEKLDFLLPDSRPCDQTFSLRNNQGIKEYTVTCKGIGNIINPYGNFMQYSFHVNDRWADYSVLVIADRYDEKRLPVFSMSEYFLTRFDSHCETQMLFGDKTCDCMEQLNIAQE